MAPLLLCASAVSAENDDAPTFRLPLDCELGRDCYIQQYVDRNPATGSVQDFACGQVVKDGHKGTDFAVPTFSDMASGVTVRSAAAGTVRGVRDGMPDINTLDPMAPDVTNRECGNGVAIDHGNDWETQYCHLREGSVLVEQGQKLEAGEPLGLVGLSGMATLPHVHFSVRHGNSVIDPFQPDMGATCSLTLAHTLWQDPPIYRPGGILEIGIIDRVPSYDEVKDGLPSIGLPTDASPAALVIWTFNFGGEIGDEVRLSLEGPQGPLGTDRVPLEDRQPLLYRAWGKRAPNNGFPPGAYRGEVIHLRGDAELDRREIQFIVLGK